MNNAKILVIEDEKDQRDTICSFVSKIEGINLVDSACDGMQGTNLIKSKKYDIIIMDFIMQYLDGLEILKFIKSFNINTKTIMVSAIGKSNIIKKAFDLGLDYYLKKSFNFQNLKNVILDLLYSQNDDCLNMYNFLMRLGIQINLSGFNYINDALKFMIKDKSTKIEGIYRKIALESSTSVDCVEANIRNAILSAYKSNNELYKKIFHFLPNDKKPKNSIFLNILIQYLENGG